MGKTVEVFTVKGKPRILLVDDHKVVVEGLRLLLGALYTIVGELTDGSKITEVVARTRPDIVLLDLSIGSYNGLDLISTIAAADCTPDVVILSMYSRHVMGETAIQRGASAYICKSDGSDVLMNEIARVIQNRLDGKPFPQTPRLLLTRRQSEIVRLIGLGKTSREIARILHISERTVHFHRTTIRKRLGINSNWAMYEFATQYVERCGINQQGSGPS